MKRELAKILAGCTIAVLATSQNALALPGQTTAQFLAWAKQSVIGTVYPARNEMSGETYYHKAYHTGGPTSYEVVFTGETDGAGKIAHETLAVQHVGDMETYDIRKHVNVSHVILAWTYGANVAADFGDAKLVADYKSFQSPTHVAVYRGRLYGYQLSGIAVEVMRLKDVDAAAKVAKDCSTRECGD